MSEPNSQQAIFWDFENVPIHDTCQGLVKELKENGTINCAYAYADWTKYSREGAEVLHKYGFILIHVPDKSPNSVDKVMGHMILECLYSGPHVETFVLVSGDSDFEIIIDHLKRKDRSIRIVSNPVITSQVMMEIGDEYRDIHSYFPAIESRIEDEVRKKPSKKTELEILRKGAVIGLLEAIQAIVEAGNKPGTGHVKHVIQSLNPEFSEDKLGFSGWIDFLSWVENEEKLIEQVGSLPGTILRIPDELIDSSQSLIEARRHGFERLVQTVEEMLDAGKKTTLPNIGQETKRANIDYNVFGYIRLSDFVQSARRRAFVSLIPVDATNGVTAVVPKYSIETLRQWFEERSKKLLGRDATMHTDAELQQTSLQLKTSLRTLNGLERLLGNTKLMETYATLMEFNGIELPLDVRINVMARLDGGARCEDISEHLTPILIEIGLEKFKCP